MVYQPIGDKLYYATRGDGAWLVRGGRRGRAPMHVSDVRVPAQIRMVASKSHRTETIDRVRAELGITDELNVGSVGLKLGLIAEGLRDLYVNPAGHSKLWDACGPEALLVEAGGRLTDVAARRSTIAGASSATCAGSSPRTASCTTRSCARLAALFPGGAARE